MRNHSCRQTLEMEGLGFILDSVRLESHAVFVEQPEDEMLPRIVRRPHVGDGLVGDVWILLRCDDTVQKDHGRRAQVDLTVNQDLALGQRSENR